MLHRKGLQQQRQRSSAAAAAAGAGAAMGAGAAGHPRRQLTIPTRFAGGAVLAEDVFAQVELSVGRAGGVAPHVTAGAGHKAGTLWRHVLRTGQHSHMHAGISIQQATKPAHSGGMSCRTKHVETSGVNGQRSIGSGRTLEARPAKGAAPGPVMRWYQHCRAAAQEHWCTAATDNHTERRRIFKVPAQVAGQLAAMRFTPVNKGEQR